MKPAGTVVVRPYRDTDAKAFVGLVRALADYEKLPPPGAKAAARLVRDAGRLHRVLLAVAGRRPVGYAIWYTTYSSFLARPTMFLEDIFVLPECRGLGAGHALMRAVLGLARKMKCGRMEWIVLDWNRPAHRFYRRMGFRPLKGWTLYRTTLR